ncbi:MAG: ABC transporter permease, partial [Muribaculaceae bacterium]|nr:ABC transporter permease [Muribaculaceae bacterium]
SISVAVDSVLPNAGAVRRYATPDFVRVFRYEGTNGETPEHLAELLKNPHNILVSDNLFHQDESKVNASSLVNRTVILGGDSASTATIAAALNVVRYSDYTPAEWSKSIIRQIPKEVLHYANELCVRVKENMDVDFAENLKADSESQLRVGNLFIADVISFDRIRHSYQLAQERKLRDYTIGMVFLLINIFLGLLGTFWFRTQQRVGEIAVRKVSGATRCDIFVRLIGEGLLLLTVVTVVALAVDINMAYMEFNTSYGGSHLYWPRVLTAAGVAYLLMVIMVILGIYFPARRAMMVEPAEVLRDE